MWHLFVLFNYWCDKDKISVKEVISVYTDKNEGQITGPEKNMNKYLCRGIDVTDTNSAHDADRNWVPAVQIDVNNLIQTRLHIYQLQM